jgi:hypothetical protein
MRIMALSLPRTSRQIVPGALEPANLPSGGLEARMSLPLAAAS